jgi:hypothetical protein
MLWIEIAWIAMCWIIGAATRAPVGCGLFLAPLLGLLAVSASGIPNLGWLIAAATISLPVIFYIRDVERTEAEKQKKQAEEAARLQEARIRRQVQTNVNYAYEALKELSENEEAVQLCRDCEEFYWSGSMETESCMSSNAGSQILLSPTSMLENLKSSGKKNYD